MTTSLETLVPEKDEIRRRVWQAMQTARVARFPGAWGRIPNFDGAAHAADRARDLPVWRVARVVKSNPDSPQLPLRRAALREGKVVYMAVPRLRQEECFIELDPERLDDRAGRSATIKGASQHGRPVLPKRVPPIDLVVAGSVAAARDGSRLGKGGGYSDLEFAILTELGRITPDTIVITTIHPLQLSDDPLPMRPHDISLDYIVTPDAVIECPRVHPRPRGILWELLPKERLDDIPILRRLSPRVRRL